MCQVSGVRCQASGVRCQDKVVELVSGGSVINGATPSSFQTNDGIYRFWLKMFPKQPYHEETIKGGRLWRVLTVPCPSNFNWGTVVFF